MQLCALKFLLIIVMTISTSSKVLNAACCILTVHKYNALAIFAIIPFV